MDGLARKLPTRTIIDLGDRFHDEYFSNSKKIIEIFMQALLQEGVDINAITKALTATRPVIEQNVNESIIRCAHILLSNTKLEMCERDAKRKDHISRLLIHYIKKYFSLEEYTYLQIMLPAIGDDKTGFNHIKYCIIDFTKKAFNETENCNFQQECEIVIDENIDPINDKLEINWPNFYEDKRIKVLSHNLLIKIRKLLAEDDIRADFIKSVSDQLWLGGDNYYHQLINAISRSIDMAIKHLT